MIVRRRLVPRAFVAAVAAIGLAVACAPAMAGAHKPAPSGLAWGPCANADATAAGWECATYKAPLDYDRPGAGSTKIAVTRLPASDQKNRAGSLFVNYGGPGGDAVATTQAIGADLFGVVNDHYDIVAFDPRGTGENDPAIDCKVNQETEGLYSAPFWTPENIDVKALGRQVQEPRQALRRAQQGHPAARVDRQRRARHGRHPRADRRQEAQLLRLLVRHVPRRHLHEPLPEQLPGHGARRAGGRQRLHQQARGGPAGAVGRLRARAGSLLPGLRAGQGDVPVRRLRSVGRL